MVLSLLFILNSNLRRPVRKIREKHADGELLHIELSDQVSFLNKASLEAALREAPPGSRLLLDARRTDYIDPDVLSLIREFKEKIAPAFKISMQLVGFRDKYRFSDKEETVDFSMLEAREKLTPNQVLEVLRAGNKRFFEGHPLDRSLVKSRVSDRNFSSAIAAIVSGIDSQTPVEMIFDMGLGEAFVIRMPGFVIGQRAIGGVEYAVSVGGVKVVVVMGNADCSILSLAIQNASYRDNRAELAGCAGLAEVLEQIAVSIDPQQAQAFPQMSDKQRAEYLSELAQRHVNRMAQQLVRESPILNRLVQSGQIQIVSAMFDPSRGSVQFLSDSPAPANIGTSS
jgi:carbonic anhydrase/SulP family sulfate permease